MLILMQGASGSGKSTIAAFLTSHLHRIGVPVEICSADSYMCDEDENGRTEYHFDPKRLPECHAICREMVEFLLQDTKNAVIVDNTNTTKSEVQPYLDMAKKYGHKVQVVRVDSYDFDDIHGVPDETKRRQRLRMQNLLD